MLMSPADTHIHAAQCFRPASSSTLPGNVSPWEHVPMGTRLPAVTSNISDGRTCWRWVWAPHLAHSRLPQ